MVEKINNCPGSGNRPPAGGKTPEGTRFREMFDGRRVKLEGAYTAEGLYYGTHRFWDENGYLVFEAEFRDGMQLASREFYTGGQLKSQFAFLHGLKHGPCFKYYEHGGLQEVSAWLKGLPHGESKSWRKDGSLALHKQFDRGALVFLREWDEAGGLVARRG